MAGVLTPDDIDQLFAPLRRHARVALAVSGGGDSMALMRLAAEWKRGTPGAPEMTVLTVDHGLRAEARREADWVAQQAGDLGLTQQTLTWEAATPDASQADARAARYGLMADFARIHGIAALVTAHTSDDVAETFLMRLARGSGVDGLAAMAGQTAWDGIFLLRPLLRISRAQLRVELDARHAAWLEDPSNAEDRFERVRMRRALETLNQLGITRARITESASRLRRARDVIEADASAFIDAQAGISPAGYVRVPDSALRSAPDEVAIHVLRRLLSAVGGRTRVPRLRKLEMLVEQIRAGLGSPLTLAGCVVSPDHHGLLICREPGRLRAAPRPLRSGETAIWDRRFRIACAGLRRIVEVRALGEPNVAALPESVRTRHPSPALAALPAIYADNRLLGVPVPGFALDQQAPEASACSAQFIWPLESTADV